MTSTWKGRSTLPELFQGALADWPNNGYLGVRYVKAGGDPGPCFEWESYREVELSVMAIARSLRCVLADDVRPGMRVAIMGPPSPEAVRIWQACCHLSMVPVFLPTDETISAKQLHEILSVCGAVAAFIHEQHRDIMIAAYSLLEPDANGTAATHNRLQLAVVWGAGGILYTEPASELVQALTAAGVRSVQGYELFKRTHFNQEPAAAFTAMIMPAADDVAGVVVCSQPMLPGMSGLENGANQLPAGPGSHIQPAVDWLVDARKALGSCSRLQLQALTHQQLTAAAARLLRQKWPDLELAEPYVAGLSDGSQWKGRPHFPTHLCGANGLADINELIALAAATAAAGRVGCRVSHTSFPDDGDVLLADL